MYNWWALHIYTLIILRCHGAVTYWRGGGGVGKRINSGSNQWKKAHKILSCVFITYSETHFFFLIFHLLYNYIILYIYTGIFFIGIRAWLDRSCTPLTPTSVTAPFCKVFFVLIGLEFSCDHICVLIFVGPISLIIFCDLFFVHVFFNKYIFSYLYIFTLIYNCIILILFYILLIDLKWQAN